jgi:hypothetical protein
MADNITLNAGSGGVDLATDEVTSKHYQLIKLAFGALDTATLVTSSVGFPVDILAGVAEIGNVKNSGTFVTQIDGAALTSLQLIDNIVQVEDAVAGSGDSGVMPLAVRNDVLGSFAGTDGDYAPLQVNSTGAIYMISGDLLSTNNSTTDTLLSGATFTGTGDEILGYATVTVQIDASHDSAVNGMTFQLSVDNINWDDINLFTYTAADGARRFQVPATARYFRFVYTNGGTNQTHFRVQTICHVQTVLTTIHRLQDDVDPDRSVQVVKSILFAQAAGTGDFSAVDATASGNLKISVEEVNGASMPVTNVGVFAVQAALDAETTKIIGTINVAAAQTIAVTNAGTFATQEGNSTAILADTASMDTNLAIVAGAVAGSEMQCDILTAPARVRTTDTVSVALATDIIMNDTTELTPKFASFSSASTGNQALIAAVAAKTLRILSLQIIGTASTNTIYINDGTADLYADATRKIPLDVTGATGPGGLTLPFNPVGWFETAAVNRPININLGSANGVVAIAQYVEV